MTPLTSLAAGPPGELIAAATAARRGRASWAKAHALAKAMLSAPVPTGPGSGLYHGAPAVAIALHLAQHPGYADAAQRLDAIVTDLIAARLDDAGARLDRAEMPCMGDYDLITGAVGFGVYLHTLHPRGRLLAQVTEYLVRLTRTVEGPAGARPGWWTRDAPTGTPNPGFPHGHANAGLAHGAAGILALLSILALDGVTVPGQPDALRRLLDWFDTHQQGHRWPSWITPEGPSPGVGRPSWCYGAPGIAWSQYLAGRALGARERCAEAVRAVRAAVGDAEHLTSPGLCHGTAGLSAIAGRMGVQAPSPVAGPAPDGGLLDGQAGIWLLEEEPRGAWARVLLVG